MTFADGFNFGMGFVGALIAWLSIAAFAFVGVATCYGAVRGVFDLRKKKGGAGEGLDHARNLGQPARLSAVQSARSDAPPGGGLH